MKFTIDPTPAPQVETPCLVIGVFSESPLPESARLVDDASGAYLQGLVDSGDVSTALKSTTMLHGVTGINARRLLVIGCGDANKFDTVRFDAVCMSAGALLRDHSVTSAHVCLPELAVEADDHWKLRQAVVALDRANYKYTATKQPKDSDSAPLEAVSVKADIELQPALDQARGMARAYLRSRELGDLPPNICTPAYLARQARKIEASYDNVEVDVLKTSAMAELDMSALLAVGQGSANGPRLIVMKYTGTDDGSQPVILVGKGITFDTGGISLKAAPHMEQMKFDMGGAASVFGAFEACAMMQLPLNLVGIVAAAENMPDGKAYRPGDVITSMSGKTIEILNTDAEGRLVLCDALTYSRRFDPRVVVDIATLTGACVIALGHHASAVMSPHDELAEALLTAGQRAVDRGWRMPLWEDYQSQLKSGFADMKNVGGMPAGSVTAACFLSRFTDNLNWAHIDCAGSTWKWGGEGGSTGRPAGLLTQFLIDQCD